MRFTQKLSIVEKIYKNNFLNNFSSALKWDIQVISMFENDENTRFHIFVI